MRRATTRLLGLLLVLAGVTLLPAPAHAAAPTVTGVIPAYGPPGTDVTITGTGFTPTTTVRFTGKAAVGVVVGSPTSLTVPVPVGAVTGRVTVATAEGSAKSAGSFTVTSVGLSPAAGPPTTRTTVALTGFRPSEAVDVYVGTAQVALVVAGATGTATTRVTVPADAQPGEQTVTAVGRRTGYAVQSAFTVHTRWAQTGFDGQGTGANPHENTLTAATVAKSKRVWKNSFKRSLQATAVVADGTVYARSTDGVLRAYDATTGAVRWAVTIGGESTNAPVVANGRVYVDSVNIVRTYDARTGAPGWTWNTTALITGMRYANDTIYFGDNWNVLRAIDATTGQQRWEFTLDGPISITPVVDAEGRVYVVGNGDLFAIAPGTDVGSFLWRRTPYSGVYPTEPPVTDGDTVYIAAANRVVAYAVDQPGTGWSTTTASAVSSLALSNHVLFAGAGTRLTAFDAADGSVAWDRDIGLGTSGGLVTVAGGVVYGGGVTRTVAVRQTDGVRLRSWPFGGFNAGVAVSDGVAYVPDTDIGWIKGYAVPAPAPARVDPAALRPTLAVPTA